MSARAAWRLESLGFEKVYRYAGGSDDWFANGLSMGRRRADTLRGADAARRDVPPSPPCSRSLIVEATRPVTSLPAVPRRAFDQVVDRAEGHHAIATRIQREADVGEVRPRKQLRFGITKDAAAFLHDPDEWLRRVSLAIDL